MALLGTNTTINYDIDGEFRYLEDVNLVALIEFNWIWPAECVYMRAHICMQCINTVCTRRVGLREWAGLSAEEPPP
jgi:hypothetical protein